MTRRAAITHVAIMSAGEMGAAVGARLVAAGHTVFTCLDGRGQETIDRSIEAGMTPMSSHADLVANCALFLSIVPPARALPLAQAVAALCREQDSRICFVDCNAIAPEQARRIAALFDDLSARFVDAGIVGAPPIEHLPRLYHSGPAGDALAVLGETAFVLRDLGPEPGRASAFKMCYASMTKGINALMAAAFMTAQANGLLDPLIEEFSESQSALWNRANANIPRLPADGARWSDEMHEIAACFAEAGLPAGFHQSAADIMARMAASAFGGETRRTRDKSRDLKATILGLDSA